jgi:predicted amidophosphoribosyltransferase
MFGLGLPELVIITGVLAVVAVPLVLAFILWRVTARRRDSQPTAPVTCKSCGRAVATAAPYCSLCGAKNT